MPPVFRIQVKNDENRTGEEKVSYWLSLLQTFSSEKIHPPGVSQNKQQQQQQMMELPNTASSEGDKVSLGYCSSTVSNIQIQ